MSHTCHWPGCKVEVPPRMWGCFKHWSMLPMGHRKAIRDAYVTGQEIRKDPSKRYIKAAQRAQKWIEERYR